MPVLSVPKQTFSALRPSYIIVVPTMLMLTVMYLSWPAVPLLREEVSLKKTPALFQNSPPSKDKTATTKGSVTAVTRRFFRPLPTNARPTCIFITENPDVDGLVTANDPYRYRFNSRSLCILPSVCIRPSTADALPQFFAGTSFTSTDPPPACILAHADLNPGSSKLPRQACTRFVEEYVTCGHGRYRGKIKPKCPTVEKLDDIPSDDKSSAKWLDDDEVPVIIPAIPFMENIFHFSFVAGFAAQVTEQLPKILSIARKRAGVANAPPPKKVALVFRGPTPKQLGAWQFSLFTAQLSRLRGLNVRVISLNELTDTGGLQTSGNSNNLFCARTAVLLGQRGNVNLWPFANNSVVPMDGSSASAQALWTRRAMYDMHGVDTQLPARRAVNSRGRPDEEPVTRIELPPLSLAYARRDTSPDPPPGKYVIGNTRRFSDADDAWFVSMLREEAKRHGATFTELRDVGSQSVRTQVQTFSKFGIIAGIHGANLANVLYARTFGALVEIVLSGARLPCYQAGMNSGLAYRSIVADAGTVQETRCLPSDSSCRWKQNRLVKIGRREIREDIRRNIADALVYVKRLRKKHPDGIPIRYVAGEDRYLIGR